MLHARSLLASTALCLSLMTTSAAADLTAAEVWGDWRSYMEGMGYQVTATQSVAGNTLSANDISLEISGGPDIDRLILTMGSWDFVEQGDGSVEIVMPPVLPITVNIAPKSTPKPTVMEMSLAQTGHKMVATGTPEAMTYQYDADTIELNLTSLDIDGEVFDESAARFSVRGEGLTSSTDVALGAQRTYDQTADIDQITYDMMFKAPQAVEAFSLSSTAQNMRFKGSSAMPEGGVGQAQEMLALIAAGFAFDGMFETQGTETKIEVTSEDGVSKIKTGSASSTLAVAMGPEGVRYNVGTEQSQIGAQLAGLPIPLFAELASSGMTMQIPVLKSDTSQDFSIGFDMTEFKMSDIIWALFDPSAQLPRDPATVALELNGKMRVLVDALNPEKFGELAARGVTPAELDTLAIKTLVVDAVGAKLEANGSITLDNENKTTLPGFPNPVGDINISLAGANGLMDKLVAMGLLPADQIMGARMMLGLFAVPGDGPDTLKSKIEFNEAGQILANGQRIK